MYDHSKLQEYYLFPWMGLNSLALNSPIPIYTYYPLIYRWVNACIYLYTWVVSGTVRVRRLFQEYNLVLRLKPAPLDPESRALTISPPCLAPHSCLPPCSPFSTTAPAFFLPQEEWQFISSSTGDLTCLLHQSNGEGTNNQ